MSECVELQKQFWNAECERGATGPGGAETHRWLCAHLFSEVAELLGAVDWKMHHRATSPDPYALTEECVDIFKFLLNVLHHNHVTEQQFIEVFRQKSVVVANRVVVERLKQSRQLLAISDLDGILCDRDSALLLFIKRMTGELFTSTKHAKMLLTPARYHHLKERFYTDGGFMRCLPIHAEVRNFTALSQRARLICTTRDVRRFPQLAYQTLNWVRANVGDVPVLFAREKEKDLSWVPAGSLLVDDEEDLSALGSCDTTWGGNHAR